MKTSRCASSFRGLTALAITSRSARDSQSALTRDSRQATSRSRCSAPRTFTATSSRGTTTRISQPTSASPKSRRSSNRRAPKRLHALLLDCGDTIQGTPLAYYFAEKDTSKPNPTIAAFNALHYDAMAVGNHEFNFGEEVMWKAKSESQFPWLAANVEANVHERHRSTSAPTSSRTWTACAWASSGSSRREFRAGKFPSITKAMNSSRSSPPRNA